MKKLLKLCLLWDYVAVCQTLILNHTEVIFFCDRLENVELPNNLLECRNLDRHVGKADTHSSYRLIFLCSSESFCQGGAVVSGRGASTCLRAVLFLRRLAASGSVLVGDLQSQLLESTLFFIKKK